MVNLQFVNGYTGHSALSICPKEALQTSFLIGAYGIEWIFFSIMWIKKCCWSLYIENNMFAIAGNNLGNNWPLCYKIIKGICEGLKYFQEGL
jgi:hypothetical protein